MEIDRYMERFLLVLLVFAGAAVFAPGIVVPEAAASGRQNPACNRDFSHERCQYVQGLIAGLERQAIVCRAADGATAAPLLLAFHGHGGCALQMAVSTRLHDAWPQAVVVYPDGLAGVATPNDPAGNRTGWQLYPGVQEDRDLALVDAVLTHAALFGADAARAYALGHSNGSRFTAVLWAARGTHFRAFLFNAAQPGDLFTLYGGVMPALPVALVMGRADCVVPFNAALGCSTPVLFASNYQEASINLARRQLGIPEGETPTGVRIETGQGGAELGLYVHDGAHLWPDGLSQGAVDFFQRH